MDMPAISKGQVLRYTLLPQVMPRLHDLVGSGFWHLAYYMALVFRAANILPATHPFVRTGAIGTYGIIAVLSEAANNLAFKRKNLDQLVLFAAILTGIVILFVQFGLLLVSFLINPATAQSGGASMPANIGEFFVRADVKEDIAFRMLDRVFGVKGLFNSKEAEKIGQFHEALHGMFQFYSIGLLVIGVLILTYFVAAVVAETAEHGTPFGKRFNHVWAPIRLVVAIGLLIPIGQGLNSAQWITLYAAKFGSNFASNGWSKFNEVLGQDSTALLGTKDTLVGSSNAPEMMHIVEFMMIARTCKILTEEKIIKARAGSGDAGGGGAAGGSNGNMGKIEAYLVKSPGEGGNGQQLGSYDQALKFFNKGDILIRFGELDASYHTEMKGYVYPYCGDMVLQTTNLKEPGAMKLQEEYFNLVKELWGGSLYEIDTHAQGYAKAYGQIPGQRGEPRYSPGTDYKKETQAALKTKVEGYIEAAVTAQKESDTWNKEREKINQWGWGGAGAWYNRVAQINGSLVGAVQAVPRARKYPAIMENVLREKEQQDKYVDNLSKYTPGLADGKAIKLVNLGDAEIARTLNEVYVWWQAEGLRNDDLSSHTKLTGNAIIDAINVIFGTKGLFDMCKNADIHPLAQLSNVGKGIIEASIRNLGFSVATGAVGGLGSLLHPHIGAALGAASSFFVSVAMVGIVIGFVLFYVLPFLPFLYFFFAVGGWVKGLFEAMVGVPLWALAHLRIDGEGLPGDAAMNGYYLIFEVFLRPILIVFGLLASVAIFSAMVKVLNDIFHLVVSNLSGFNPETTQTCKGTGTGGGSTGTGGGSTGSSTVGSAEYFRGPIDEFFFTIIYAIIVYMIGMSSFKLIDLIPNNILRWMGAGVATFGDQAGEPAEGLVQRVSVGGSALTGQMKEAVSDLSSAAGGAASAAARSLQRPPG